MQIHKIKFINNLFLNYQNPSESLMNTGRSNRLTFPKNPDLSFIQEFVNTKVHNPDLIKQLKLKQLKKFELQKAKLRQQNLLTQLQKNHKNLLKAKNIHAELKQSALTKDQEAFKYEEKIFQMEQKLEKLLMTFKQSETDKKSEKDLKVKELKTLSQQSAKNLEDEHNIFKALLENKQQKLSTVLQKKLKMKESLLSRKNSAKITQTKNESLKMLHQQKRKRLLSLEEIKTTLCQRIKSKVLLKEKALKKIKTRFSQNTKSQQECIKKLVKFVKELNQIVQDPKSELEEKKNMISLLLNVYCPDETIQEKARTISIQIEVEKEKHDSIQTRISLGNGSQSSVHQIKHENEQNGPKIPLILLHTLQQMEIKYGLKQKLKDSKFEQPVIIRKKSSNQQTELNSHFSKLNRRDSLPTSLNEKDLQNQFFAYCQSQLNDLQASQHILDQKQGQLEKQIRLLTKKCQQKDEQIQAIIKQNRKSFRKQ